MIDNLLARFQSRQDTGVDAATLAGFDLAQFGTVLTDHIRRPAVTISEHRTGREWLTLFYSIPP
jgi:hypothetical protein